VTSEAAEVPEDNNVNGKTAGDQGENTHEMHDMYEYEHPEQLLAGADRPRPLPPHLRARLEEALEGAGARPAAATVRPIPGEVRDKLEVTLLPLGQENDEPEKKWRVWAPRLSVAAAVIIALAIFVPTLAHGPGPAHTAAGTVASTQASRSGLSILRAVPPNAQAATAKAPGAFGAVVGRPSTSASSSTAGIPAHGVPAPAAAGEGPKSLNPALNGGARAAFAAPPPVVSTVSPASGPVGGGNWVVVQGTDLGGASAVYFGGVPALRLKVVSTTEVKALAPAHSAGTVDVAVSGPGGRSRGSAADKYSFTR
jgi:IPT/TIG domain